MAVKLNPDEEHEDHESYGLISFSRRTGNPGRLFGSSLQTHEAYITMAVRKGTRISENGHDRYYGNIRGDIIEVDMSAAQFAELLTTMNVGMGVPCTVRRVSGKQLEAPPETKLEVEKARSEFKRKMGRISQVFTDKRKEAASLLDKKTLTKADKEAILAVLSKVEMEIAHNLPYALDMFEEAAEKVVVHAKAEIEAITTHNVIAEGVRSLAERMGNNTPQLPAGDETKK